MVKLNRFDPSATPEIVLLVSEALPMLVSVLPVPLIDLLVRVSVVVRATKVSVIVGRVNVPEFRIWAIVGVVRVKPATVAAVPPKLTLVDPIVIELLVRLPLAMFVSVLADPLIDLFVRVWVAVFVVTVSDPTVAAAMLKVPSVTVLPVKVRAVGNDSTTIDVPVAVISFAVPDTDATAPMPEGVMVTLAAAVSWP